MSVNRYEATPIKNLDRYQTTRYPAIPKTPRDKFIYTREQDRLDLLANEFYKDERYWWI